MNEYTVGALVKLLLQFDQDANIVMALKSCEEYTPIIDAQYNEHGDVELIVENPVDVNEFL